MARRVTSALGIAFDANDSVTEYIDRLSSARQVYLAWRLDGEVHNGGLDQFSITLSAKTDQKLGRGSRVHRVHLHSL